MRLSVAICTWNRADLLDQTLAQMQHLNIPVAIEWEVLVVNNNCTDHTDEVIDKHSKHLPIRRLLETKQGLSNARNCAVAAASGDIMIWTDDDVLVGKDWLAGYAHASNHYPDVDFFGGPILPWFEGVPPNWLAETIDRLASAYALRDLGPGVFNFTQKKVPYGANFAIRMQSQKDYLFDPKKGRKAAGMLGDDETSVIRAMLHDGKRGIWLPGVKVKHFIEKRRQSIRYLRRYYHALGVTNIRALSLFTESTASVTPKLLLKKAIKAEAQYRLGRILSPPKIWIEKLTWASRLWGQLSERKALLRQPEK